MRGSGVGVALGPQIGDGGAGRLLEPVLGEQHVVGQRPEPRPGAPTQPHLSERRRDQRRLDVRVRRAEPPPQPAAGRPHRPAPPPPAHARRRRTPPAPRAPHAPRPRPATPRLQVHPPSLPPPPGAERHPRPLHQPSRQRSGARFVLPPWSRPMRCCEPRARERVPELATGQYPEAEPPEARDGPDEGGSSRAEWPAPTGGGVIRGWNSAGPGGEAEGAPTRPSASEGAWRGRHAGTRVDRVPALS